jgi:hypothetical protein
MERRSNRWHVRLSGEDSDGDGHGDSDGDGNRGDWLGLGALLAAVLLGYHALVRPRLLTWGATADEVDRRLPGDDLVPGPGAETTRAITVDAPAAAIWPWLVQLGQGRGGMYSYTWLENLAGARMHNADRVLPDHQELAVGDTVRLYPEDSALERCVPSMEALPILTVELVEENRTLVLRGVDGGTWTFHLEPVGRETTRLLVRGRTPRGASPGERLFRYLVYELPHFVMERGMMRGIRLRAERRAGGAAHRSGWTM